MMLRLGHIDYSNCFPVHARLLDRGAPDWVQIRHGTPAQLNEALRRGEIDVAPCSSIEYARNAERYRLLPGLGIASHGPVRSILLEADVPLCELDGRDVAVPDASATSVVLLRILLERQVGVRPAYRWFDQRRDADPLDAGAHAALYIGDAALGRTREVRGRHDLGRMWTRWTGLPFVFAVWQTTLGREREDELRRLHRELLDSLAYFEAERARLARDYAPRFGLEPAELDAYWRRIRYRMDEAALEGLREFYRLAVELGEAPEAPPLRWTPGGQP